VQRLRLIVRLALRNVRRQARRSALTAAAMVVGLALLVMSRSLADGAHDEWIEAGVRLGSGHLAFQAPEFRARHAIEEHLSAADRAAVEAALADTVIAPHLKAVAPRLEITALASAAAAAVPVTVVGVDPAREPAFSEMDQRIVEGRYLEPHDHLQGFVGVELAQRLRLRLGDRLVLTAAGPDGAITDQLVRVVGTFRTAIPEVDQSLIHIPLATAQAWLGVDSGVTTIAVLLDASWNADRFTRRLQEALAPHADRIAVLSWRAASPELDAAVRMDDYGDYVFHGILFIIIALAIVNTVLMSVLYRTREFGVVRALGLRKRDTALLVLTEGLILTGISGLVGVLLGLAVTWGFFHDGFDLTAFMGDQMTAAGAVIDPVFIPQFRVVQLIQSAVSVAIVGLVASLYPAWRATRIDMAEAMKFEA